MVDTNDNSRTRPNRLAIIIGAMKCGTTSLFDLLSQHPEVCASRVKESNFFSDDSTWNRGLDWYWRLWDWKDEQHKVAIEASPTYTMWPQRPAVPERMGRVLCPKPKFIYMVRNPIDRIESHIHHGRDLAWGKELSSGRLDEAVVSITKYATQLDQYVRYFPRESIMVVTLEAFHAGPEQILKKVCEFLGIDPEYRFTEMTKAHNASKRYDMPAWWNRTRDSRFVKGPARMVMSNKVRRKLDNIISELLEPFVRRSRSRLSDRQKEIVIRELEEDLGRLAHVYGIDLLEHWQFGIMRHSDTGLSGRQSKTQE